MKPYQEISIEDCGEPLVLLPLDAFAVVTPHPYVALGAPYGDRSPYWLRKSVAAALLQAQQNLQAQRRGWAGAQCKAAQTTVFCLEHVVQLPKHLGAHGWLFEARLPAGNVP
ncbi:MAG: D-alanyl-D-alanine dipeptidase, partial [Cyanobacteria bacterium P01_H01_bin.153]